MSKTPGPMIVLETERLVLVEFSDQHAPFLLEFVNEPAWLQYIGDKKIYDLDAAKDFIEDKLRLSYEVSGFGFYVVCQKSDKVPVGICGLVDRDGLDDIDIGFAFLKKFRRQGYGFESSKAMLDYAKNTLNIDRIVAITHPDNVASGRLLEKLGLTFDKLIPFPENHEEQCRLYVESQLLRSTGSDPIN
jgi:RimJ/RimL family protein N-acetyltransferase